MCGRLSPGLRIAVLLVIWVSVVEMAPAKLDAQIIQGVYNPRDDQFRVLGLVRAQTELQYAEAELDRAEQLLAREVIARAEYDQIRAAYERARVAYLQQSLTVIFASPHVAIDRAVKSRTSDGQAMVQLTLRKATGGSIEGANLPDLLDQEMLAGLNPDEISNVYVSLKSDPGLGGAIVSSPYERRIETMRSGESITLSFRLLRDAEEVVVSINYADKVEERRVFLETDQSANLVTVQATQFSQEADLGQTATFDLVLENFAASNDLFRLIVGGLPADVTHEFRDPPSGARLTQIRFADGEVQKRLQLVLTLPQRAVSPFGLDLPIPFFALAVSQGQESQLQAVLSSSEGNSDHLATFPAGKARLELVPRGVGRLEVRALNLYHEIQQGDSVLTSVTLRNTGSRPIHDLWTRLEVPTGWRTRVEPEHVATLAVGAEQEIAVMLLPPGDAVVGDYELRLKNESTAAQRGIVTEDKMIRVHLVSPPNWIMTGTITALLFTLVGGIVFGATKLVRR